jgi:hypothetical protein
VIGVSPASSRPSLADVRCTWAVCETTQRWKRGISRFLPSDFESGVNAFLRFGSIGETLALAMHVRPLVVFWEVRLNANAELFRAIAVVARLPDAPLQLVGIPAGWDLTHADFTDLAIKLRQLGAAAVLRNPEDLRAIMRMAIH